MPEKKKKESMVSEELGKELLEAGVHFGHDKSRWHPKMKQYIYGIRKGIYIIDLEETMKKLEEALEFIKKTTKEGGKILFVSTRPQCQNMVKETAERCEMPYIISRWIGGLLTNFKTIRKRVDHLIKLEEQEKSGELRKYTKKEQSKIKKEMEKLRDKFGGIKELKKLPDAIFLLNIMEHEIVIQEAKKKKVPTISLVDVDCDPSLVDYPIPSNDDASSALKLMLEKVEEAIKKNKK
ncbi:MAG: 30S ribosomal protein S2 [Candidatus Portnoybacteria bacterium]|nr:30S ribosomal protein S2 [Candidatus Portnoybacteria bacterium]